MFSGMDAAASFKKIKAASFEKNLLVRVATDGVANEIVRHILNLLGNEVIEQAYYSSFTIFRIFS